MPDRVSTFRPLRVPDHRLGGKADEQAHLDHSDDPRQSLLQLGRKQGRRRYRSRRCSCRRRFGTACLEGSSAISARRPAMRSGPARSASRRPRFPPAAGCGCLAFSTSLLSSTTTISRRLAAATIFSRNSAPPRPLTRLSVRSSTWSAPSMLRSIRRCWAKPASGTARWRARAAVRFEVGMPTIRSPSRAIRAASNSSARAAVLPLPRPRTIPSST